MRSTGDPITAALGGRLPAAQLAERVHEAGYDRPILVQYFEYLGNLLTGDFGTTISDNRPVTQVLTTYGTATLELAVYSLLVAFVIGIPFGRLAAYLRDRWPDAVLRVFAILCYATPVFFLGMLLKLVFSIWLGWLPVAGRASTGAEIQLQTMANPTGFYTLDAIRLGNPEVIGDVLQHAILPAIALGLLTAGVFLRLVRTNVIGTLGMGYVEAARSRGVPERRLLRKHAYRPALIPIVTVIGLQIALLLGGAVLTETTFEWKGLGFQLVQYLQARDFVAVQGIVVMLAVIVAVTNFIVDVIAALIDPRVRY
jgi:peptide/nickel transport system permease protein